MENNNKELNGIKMMIADGIVTQEAAEKYFPELKKSKDERSQLTEFLKDLIEKGASDRYGRKDFERWKFWIEKQGEHKSIWHNEDEEPQRGRLILLIMQSGTAIVAKIIEPDHTFNHGERWAYIDDLLEKQGEQKTLCDKCRKEHPSHSCQDITELGRCAVEHVQKAADKVEPKFKIGDWVVDKEGHISQITRIGKDYNGITYACSLIENPMFWFLYYEDEIRLWDISDAKDGDMLTCYSDIKGQPIEQTGIIKQYVGRHGGCSNSFKAHFGVDWDNNVVIEGYMGSSNIYPATKEQRYFLFGKMREAGYEWDAEKKELKKLMEE